MCGNNCYGGGYWIWIILILIIMFGCGGYGNNCCGGCGNNCCGGAYPTNNGCGC